MMMKSSIVLTACILFLLSIAVEASNTFGPDECCFKFFSSPLPKRRVTSYKHTDNMCPMQGVMFTMRSGAVFCADPSVEWVKNVIQFKDAQAAKVVRDNDAIELYYYYYYY